MASTTANYSLNLLKLLAGNRLLAPLAVVYYVTTRCNLNCVYCEDFGSTRNAPNAALPLEQARRVLRVIRSGTDRLILTGGEPLLYPEIDALAAAARREMGFRHLTLQTNGLLLLDHPALLPLLDRLVISLDTVDPELGSRITRVPREAVETIVDNVRLLAQRQRQAGYRLIVNGVLTPETVPGALELLDFCAAHSILASFSPQAVRNWPRYELLVSDDYHALLRQLLAAKQRGAPLVGSVDYWRTLLDFRPYSCYPTLIPRVEPNGDLLYPCRPIEKEENGHGGRCNLLAVSSWRQAVRQAAAVYDAPPRVCTSCFQQCFIEPSLMQARPLALLREWLLYPPSRRVWLASYAPG